MDEDLWRLGALELAAAIRAGDVSSREVVRAHLERIDSINDSVRAVVRRLDAEALAAADRADASRTATGPLHGVPITLKENVDLAGHPTTHGLRSLADAVPARDEPVVERLKAAGAIPIARTNLPDMGLRLHTDSALHGPTYNPWDRGRTPGGSSGGEAAALATGMTPLGVGNDMCGSLRWPSQCCGVAALKPTLGAIPRGALPGLFSVELIAVHGPMARSVADLRAAFEVMAGPHPVDPWSVPVPARSEPYPHLARKRVAVSIDPGGAGVHPQVATGVGRAARLLREAGFEVVEAEPPRFAEAARLWSEITFGTASPETDPGLSSDAMRVLALWRMSTGFDPEPGGLPSALARRTEILRAWGAFFETHGLWLTPTATDLPFEVGADLAGGASGAHPPGPPRDHGHQRTVPPFRGGPGGRGRRAAPVRADRRPPLRGVRVSRSRRAGRAGRRQDLSDHTTVKRPAGRVPLATLLAYGPPALGYGLPLFLVQFYLLKYATDDLGLAPAAVGTLFALGRVWDAVIDPVVGLLSDRTRTRAGRRRPWMVVAIPVLILGFAALWNPPGSLSGAALLAWVTAALLLFYTGLSLYVIPHQALGAELTHDYHDRSLVFGARQVAFFLGMFGAFGVMQHAMNAQDGRGAVAGASLLVALLSLTTLAVPPAFLRERERVFADVQERFALRTAFDVMRDPHARLVLTVQFVDALGVGVLSPYYLEYVLGRPDLIGLVPALFVVCSVVSVPGWLVLSRRVGKRGAWIVSMLLTGTSLGLLFFVGPGDLAAVYALMVLAGIGSGCAGSIGPSILADIADHDELLGGERREGVYFAASSFAFQAGGAATILIAGLALDLAGFEPNRKQGETAELAIRLLMAGTPFLAFTATAAWFRRFRLDEAEYTSIRAELELREHRAVLRSRAAREDGA